MAKVLKISRIALYRCVKNDDFRSPDVTLVYPKVEKLEECWVIKRENGIIYTLDVTKSMFSVGNFSEKARLAELIDKEPVDKENGDVAIDMFAGIGYFSLSLLVKSRHLRFLHCCEWNPAAVEALKRNIKLNKIDPSRVEIHEGDCRLVAPKKCAQRVFLGLIPSSEIAWESACLALDPSTGGVLHIHSLSDNSPDAIAKLPPGKSPNEFEMERCRDAIEKLLVSCHPDVPNWQVQCSFISNVKFYGPLLRHIVIDLHCKPLL